MHITIAYDGSPSGHEALRWAAKLFPTDHDLTVVHVASDLFKGASLQSRSMVPEALASIQAKIDQEAASMLQKATTFLSSHHVRAVRSKLLYGHPVEQLCHASEHEATDLIMVGKRGLSPLKSFFLGSVSDGVLRHSKTSIMLVPVEAHQDPPDHSKMLRLSVGYDGSAASRKALDFLKAWTPHGVEELSLVTVVGANFTYGMANALEQVSIDAELVADAQSQLNKLREALASVLPASAVQAHVITDALDISSALDEFARDHQAHVTIVGSKGHNTFERMILGSVAHKLAHQTNQPLLVVR